MSTSDPAQTKQHVWQRLHAAGFVSGDEPDITNTESPWFIKILIAICGWLAALFLFVFVGMFFSSLLDNRIACLLVGAILIGGAFAILNAEEGDFADHLALAGSFAGQGLVIWGAVGADFDDPISWLLISILHTALSYQMPHFVHRLLSALLATGSLAVSFGFAGIPQLFPALALTASVWLWLHEFSFPRHVERIAPAAYGISLAMSVYMSNVLWGWPIDWFYHAVEADHNGVASWASQLIGAAAMLYLAWRLLDRAGKQLSDRPSLICLLSTLFVCIASHYAQGLSMGLALVLLGFASSNRLLLGLGLTSLLLFLSAYYYWLELTLLTKSQILLAIGITLLLVRRILRYALLTQQEPPHA